jgi:hypothetical protein
MAVADRHGLPVGVHVESATPHEVKLAVPTLVEMVIPEAPQNLVGDNAYDSDKLDSELNQYGIQLISPHRSNRKNKTQDRRRLRQYRRRWKVDRLFAWLQLAGWWSATNEAGRGGCCFLPLSILPRQRRARTWRATRAGTLDGVEMGFCLAL